jgi:hypothetical protein
VDFAALASTVVVVADVFSGMPNPQWPLTPEQRSDLVSRLQSIRETDQAVEFPGLGYRGMLVLWGEGAPASAELRVFGGYATFDIGRVRMLLRDEGRALEKWLLATGRGLLYSELYEMLGAEI